MSESFEIEIHSLQKSYKVIAGEGNARACMDTEEDIIVVADALLQKFFPWMNHPKCINIPALEASKTLETVAQVIEKMRVLGATRHSHLLAIGGGIIQDISTFVASSYMRGIDWSYLPTTLLGMVDSCIGGKSSLNVGPYKNIAGNFYPPDQVVIDTEFCTSLPSTQKLEGLCEAVKICYASSGPEFFEYQQLAGNSNPLEDRAALSKIIRLSLETKKKFIEEDEFDNGVRLLLNFGHTFGHAIEGASDFRISHGIAVGLGMLCAARFSESSQFSDRSIPRIQSLETYVRDLLSRVPGLYAPLSQLSPTEVLKRFRSDKKHTRDQFAVIAFDEQGYLARLFVPSSEENAGRIIESVEWLKQEIC